TNPPASRTRSTPAAVSHRSRSSSQKPSIRPAATQARSRAAEPKRRGRCHPGKIKGAGAEAADAGDLRRDRRVDLRPLDRVAAPEERDSGPDQAVGEMAAGRDAQARAPARRAPAPLPT